MANNGRVGDDNERETRGTCSKIVVRYRKESGILNVLMQHSRARHRPN